MLTRPTGNTNLLVAVFTTNNLNMASMPAGWQGGELTGVVGPPTVGLFIAFKKTAPTGEPATYTFTFTGATNAVGRILNYGSGGPAFGENSSSSTALATLQAPAAALWGLGVVIEAWCAATATQALGITTKVNSALAVRAADGPVNGQTLLIAEYTAPSGTLSMTGDTAGDATANTKNAGSAVLLPTGS